MNEVASENKLLPYSCSEGKEHKMDHLFAVGRNEAKYFMSVLVCSFSPFPVAVLKENIKAVKKTNYDQEDENIGMPYRPI